jgi:alkyl sulfatase BDS1-like metallo-beta-lactamase superfamily hydrolase
MRALTLDQLFDALAIRVDGPRSWDADICVRWNVKDREPITVRLRNGVLTHVTGIGPAAREPDVEVALDEDALRALLLGEAPVSGLVEQGRAKADGDLTKVDELLGHLGEPDPDFAIVTP